ncbi:MAG: hypothetical protein ACREMZ_17700 [Gemmatimonadales bacterium]
MREPRRDHYLPPTIGEDSEVVLAAAIDSLGRVRGMGLNGDAATTLHLLASLIAQAQQRLPRAVADARDQDCSWAEIADLLGVTRASAWQRYAGRTPTNRTPLKPD